MFGPNQKTLDQILYTDRTAKDTKFMAKRTISQIPSSKRRIKQEALVKLWRVRCRAAELRLTRLQISCMPIIPSS